MSPVKAWQKAIDVDRLYAVRAPALCDPRRTASAQVRFSVVLQFIVADIPEPSLVFGQIACVTQMICGESKR